MDEVTETKAVEVATLYRATEPGYSEAELRRRDAINLAHHNASHGTPVAEILDRAKTIENYIAGKPLLVQQ